MGAFFFVRSLLTFVNNEAPFAGNTNGWILTAFFFFDAWLLGEWGAGLQGAGCWVLDSYLPRICCCLLCGTWSYAATTVLKGCSTGCW